MSSQASTSRIEAVISEPLAALGLDVEAVELTPAGKRSVLRVAVDQDRGVTLDDVADATRAVNAVLDDPAHAAVMGEQAYTLEVTSRGVDRPLSLPRHWRRNADRLVKVTLGGGESLTGRILASEDAEDGGATIDVGGGERWIGYAEVTRAVVQIEFNRKPGPEEDD